MSESIRASMIKLYLFVYWIKTRTINTSLRPEKSINRITEDPRELRKKALRQFVQALLYLASDEFKLIFKIGDPQKTGLPLCDPLVDGVLHRLAQGLSQLVCTLYRFVQSLFQDFNPKGKINVTAMPSQRLFQ
eukprot:238055-Karenia_brevis.AAC.1